MLTRPAAPADAELIAHHRAHMFADSGQSSLAALAEAHLSGIQVVSLHASRLGRPIYERSGLELTNEMILRIGKG